MRYSIYHSECHGRVPCPRLCVGRIEAVRLMATRSCGHATPARHDSAPPRPRRGPCPLPRVQPGVGGVRDLDRAPAGRWVGFPHLRPAGALWRWDWLSSPGCARGYGQRPRWGRGGRRTNRHKRSPPDAPAARFFSRSAGFALRTHVFGGRRHRIDDQTHRIVRRTHHSDDRTHRNARRTHRTDDRRHCIDRRTHCIGRRCTPDSPRFTALSAGFMPLDGTV